MGPSRNEQLLWASCLNRLQIVEHARDAERLKLVRKGLPPDGDGRIIFRVQSFLCKPRKVPLHVPMLSGRRVSRMMSYCKTRNESDSADLYRMLADALGKHRAPDLNNLRFLSHEYEN